MKYRHYFNTVTSQPVKAPDSRAAAVEQRHDIVPLTEEQYNDVVNGVLEGKVYHFNGTNVIQLGQPNRALKWFERIEYDTGKVVPTPTIVKKSQEEIKSVISIARKSAIANNPSIDDRAYNAYREILESNLPEGIYHRRDGSSIRVPAGVAANEVARIAEQRQVQFIIEDLYIKAYEAGHDIPNPLVAANWSIEVISQITHKPTKSKRGKL